MCETGTASQIKRRCVRTLLFKNKDHLDLNKKWYGVGIMSENGLSDEQYDRLTNKILDAVNNVGMTSDLIRKEWDEKQLNILNQRIQNRRLSDPCFIVNEMVPELIEREKKLLEKNHKWRKMLGLLMPIEYMAAETRAIFNFRHTLLYTDDLEEVVEFLKTSN